MADKCIVLTMYGQDEQVDGVSVTLFDSKESNYSFRDKSAIQYCNSINDLELAGTKWIYAAVIEESAKIILSKPPRFDIINQLDNRSLQKVIREIEPYILAPALVNVDEETKEKIFSNMSSIAAAMLKENIESLTRGVSNDDIKTAQQHIIQIMQRLEKSGQIVW